MAPTGPGPPGDLAAAVLQLRKQLVLQEQDHLNELQSFHDQLVAVHKEAEQKLRDECNTWKGHALDREQALQQLGLEAQRSLNAQAEEHAAALVQRDADIRALQRARTMYEESLAALRAEVQAVSEALRQERAAHASTRTALHAAETSRTEACAELATTHAKLAELSAQAAQLSQGKGSPAVGDDATERQAEAVAHALAQAQEAHEAEERARFVGMHLSGLFADLDNSAAPAAATSTPALVREQCAAAGTAPTLTTGAVPPPSTDPPTAHGPCNSAGAAPGHSGDALRSGSQLSSATQTHDTNSHPGPAPHAHDGSNGGEGTQSARAAPGPGCAEDTASTPLRPVPRQECDGTPCALTKQGQGAAELQGSVPGDGERARVQEAAGGGAQVLADAGAAKVHPAPLTPPVPAAQPLEPHPACGAMDGAPPGPRPAAPRPRPLTPPNRRSPPAAASASPPPAPGALTAEPQAASSAVMQVEVKQEGSELHPTPQPNAAAGQHSRADGKPVTGRAAENWAAHVAHNVKEHTPAAVPVQTPACASDPARSAPGPPSHPHPRPVLPINPSTAPSTAPTAGAPPLLAPVQPAAVAPPPAAVAAPPTVDPAAGVSAPQPSRRTGFNLPTLITQPAPPPAVQKSAQPAAARPAVTAQPLATLPPPAAQPAIPAARATPASPVQFPSPAPPVEFPSLAPPVQFPSLALPAVAVPAGASGPNAAPVVACRSAAGTHQAPHSTAPCNPSCAAPNSRPLIPAPGPSSVSSTLGSPCSPVEHPPSLASLSLPRAPSCSPDTLRPLPVTATQPPLSTPASPDAWFPPPAPLRQYLTSSPARGSLSPFYPAYSPPGTPQAPTAARANSPTGPTAHVPQKAEPAPQPAPRPVTVPDHGQAGAGTPLAHAWAAYGGTGKGDAVLRAAVHLLSTAPGPPPRLPKATLLAGVQSAVPGLTPGAYQLALDGGEKDGVLQSCVGTSAQGCYQLDVQRLAARAKAPPVHVPAEHCLPGVPSVAGKRGPSPPGAGDQPPDKRPRPEEQPLDVYERAMQAAHRLFPGSDAQSVFRRVLVEALARRALSQPGARVVWCAVDDISRGGSCQGFEAFELEYIAVLNVPCFALAMGGSQWRVGLCVDWLLAIAQQGCSVPCARGLVVNTFSSRAQAERMYARPFSLSVLLAGEYASFARLETPPPSPPRSDALMVPWRVPAHAQPHAFLPDQDKPPSPQPGLDDGAGPAGGQRQRRRWGLLQAAEVLFSGDTMEDQLVLATARLLALRGPPAVGFGRERHITTSALGSWMVHHMGDEYDNVNRMRGLLELLRGTGVFRTTSGPSGMTRIHLHSAALFRAADAWVEEHGEE